MFKITLHNRSNYSAVPPRFILKSALTQQQNSLSSPLCTCLQISFVWLMELIHFRYPIWERYGFPVNYSSSGEWKLNKAKTTWLNRCLLADWLYMKHDNSLLLIHESICTIFFDSPHYSSVLKMCRTVTSTHVPNWIPSKSLFSLEFRELNQSSTVSCRRSYS